MKPPTRQMIVVKKAWGIETAKGRIDMQSPNVPLLFNTRKGAQLFCLDGERPVRVRVTVEVISR